ncbi:NrsF family protein [Jiella avicenniae]|uniref:NrsF family protein n=1 Tax=Jiella avicenniae TaxID=2907202 RepID=A0A9X1T684_9HYPH|nr:NrsF family protein [Jiella avicenniae]MCE7029080.1 NrsF family protein [Jiella avicenniae]
MQTDQLIADLASQATRPKNQFTLPLWLAVALAPFVALAVFMPMLGPRANFVASLATVRFDMKFVVTGLLAVTALALLAALARPARPVAYRLKWLALPTLMLLAAVVVELLVVPEAAWAERAVGQNARNCLIAIPTMGAPVLALFLYALSDQAPTRPALSGAVAGLAAAGISAIFYAAHCPDDSPLFVAVWYPLATAILVVGGAGVGSRLLRW